MSQLIDTVGGLWLRPYVLPEAQRGLETKTVTYVKISPKMMNHRDIDLTGNAELKDEEDL